MIQIIFFKAIGITGVFRSAVTKAQMHLFLCALIASCIIPSKHSSILFEVMSEIDFTPPESTLDRILLTRILSGENLLLRYRLALQLCGCLHRRF